MGVHHSKEQKSKRLLDRSIEYSNNSTQHLNSSIITTPTLSRSSSTVNSKATSMMGDMKGYAHKMLGKPTTDSLVRSSPGRSISAPAELFIVDDQKKHFPLVTDEQEQDRLTNTHFVLKHCFGDNFAAPVHDLLSGLTPSYSVTGNSFSSTTSLKTSSTRTLDIACGSGVWVLEMATNYPSTDFHGIDIAPVFPNFIKPSNTFFQQCDMLDTEGFPYPDEYFDYIHMRLVYNCFSNSDLKFILNEMNRVLKPGGFIEIRDIDPIIKNPGPVTERIFSDFTTKMYEEYSIDVSWTKRIDEILKNEAELADVHHQQVAIGGTESLDSIKCSFLDTLDSYKEYLLTTYDMSPEEVDETIKTIKKECDTHQSYFLYYMGWGRKPLTPEKLVQVPYPAKDVEMSILAHDIVHLTQGFTE